MSHVRFDCVGCNKKCVLLWPGTNPPKDHLCGVCGQKVHRHSATFERADEITRKYKSSDIYRKTLNWQVFYDSDEWLVLVDKWLEVKENP